MRGPGTAAAEPPNASPAQFEIVFALHLNWPNKYVSRNPFPRLSQGGLLVAGGVPE